MMCLLALLLLWAGSVSAAVHNVSTSGQLTTAMAAAVAGDEIILANGTYTGSWNTGNAGSSGSKITLRALNKHLAILQGTDACDDNAIGITVDQPWWVIENIQFLQHGSALRLESTNAEIRHNIIENYRKIGVWIIGGDTNFVHHNAIMHTFGCTDNYGIIITTNADGNIVQDNLVIGTGDQKHSSYGDQQGYGMVIQNDSDDNLTQGNIFLANLGKGVHRILSGEATSPNGTNRNLVYDNGFFFGEGELSSGDCTDDASQYINNIMYGNFFWNWATKGNFDGSKGHHILHHNLFYATPQTRASVGFITGGEPFCSNTGGYSYKILNEMKDNLFYADHAQETSGTVAHQLLWMEGQGSSPAAFVTNGNADNLFWAPGSDAGWVANYTYAGSDIHATGSEPLFTSASTGDFSLQSGSPGKGAGTGGTDMGIAYNSFLKLAWIQNVFALAPLENTSLSGVTSTNFTVTQHRWYQVWFALPNSPGGGCGEQFTVEGATTDLHRDVTALNIVDWVQTGGPARYITLGRHRSTDNTTLAVSWENTTCVDKVRIRPLPTAAEAYGWISALAASDSALTPFRLVR